MRRTALALTVLTGLASVALADPAPIRLTRDQILAAAKAVQAKLPPVDKGQVAQCQKLLDEANQHDPTAPELLALGTCYRSAGSLGAAIIMWQHVLAQYGSSKEAEEAQRSLGPAYEAAGMFMDAAKAYDAYVERYGKAGDRDLEVRAVCTWEQLGFDDQIKRGLNVLTRRWPKVTVDPAHLCDTVRPIQPPAP
jgi:tetratricopeptide (TPR) repeat protein